MVLTDCQILKNSQPKPPNQGEGFFSRDKRSCCGQTEAGRNTCNGKEKDATLLSSLLELVGVFGLQLMCPGLDYKANGRALRSAGNDCAVGVLPNI